ncbi:hypothetical protein GCM10010435_70270 [Winogradskya consettensis]|uniref:DUF1023 domain-containing protein n=1 Tax=Winogradskya consettensis TaxID=113560 RepID=A0A919VU87_9ACTN|nr:alpha/beta hydrolase [Actinoplanes consettensis]GIM75535.1 hypothetical protein Aco04nite_45840 [Actinoplanes consettensis]
MSGVTLQLLLAADAGPWQKAATTWRDLAMRIDDAAEQLIRGTRGLEDAWPDGPGSAAALAESSRLQAEVSNTYNPAYRIYQTLDLHAHGLSDLRGQAESIVSSARQKGMKVDTATGTVTAPASAPDGERQVVAVIGELEAVLSRAAALDDSTANAINVNLPDASTGFGQFTMPPVIRDTLAEQGGRTPAEIQGWWNALTPAQQEQAIHDFPDLVGAMDGVPATDRDTANRIMLDKDKVDLTRRAADLQAAIDKEGPRSHRAVEMRDELKQVRKELDGLDAVTTKLADLGPKGLLLGLDPAGDGRAIIAVGNPDTARHTAVWVPGLNTELTDTRGNVNRVVNLQQAADSRTAQADDVAGIMWLGYDAPELSNVGGSGRSEQGGPLLDRFVDGLRATHDPGASHVTVEGHSYGSTVVAEAALRGDGLAADDIITAGSPGMHTDRAADLQIDPKHVWGGQADGDPVAGALGSVWGVHGNEPTDEDFGANRYVTDTEGHSDYWKPGSQSLLNQAKVVVGQYDQVSLMWGEPPTS